MLTNAHVYAYTAIAKPALLSAKGSSKQFLFTTSMSNKEWIENTGESRYFIYPIHSSGCFMASKSIASSLYLVLIRLMTRKYEDAFVLIEGCVSDIALSKQGMYGFIISINIYIYICMCITYDVVYYYCTIPTSNDGILIIICTIPCILIIERQIYDQIVTVKDFINPDLHAFR